MIIAVRIFTRATPGAPLTLEDPQNFQQFHVLAEAVSAADAIDAIVSEGGVAVDESHVFVPVELIRSLAAADATSDWEEGFSGMAKYAASKGWCDDEGRIRAHVEVA